MLKYFYAHINYAGRIHRAEDQVTLNAILDDLVGEEMALLPERPADPASSHHGFPPAGEGVDLFSYFDKAIPTRDAYQVYGFNWTIESHLLRSEIFEVLERMHALNRGWGNEVREASQGLNLRTSIEMSTLQASLRSGASESGAELRKMIGDEESLLNLFSAMQKLLGASSLDKTVAQGGRRYDHQTD
jgi:hypothetical protein